MEYIDYLKKVLNNDEIDLMLKEYEKKPITSLRINYLKSDINSFKNLFDNLENHKHVKEAFYYDKEKYEFGKYPLHNAGMYYIQDASEVMVAYLLDVQKGDKVLDLCAAPGGKSSQVASYLGGSGLLVSNDISPSRVKALSENIERMGASNVIVTNEAVDKIANVFSGYFDKVILDAPCSGQGMFRKNSLTYDDWSFDKTLSLSNIQKDLIFKAYKCLKKNGVLVYSTCTFAKEENEEVIDYLLENTSASVINIKREKDYSDAINIDGAIRLYPFKFKGEGHFICLIKCNDEHDCSVKNTNKLASKKDIEIYREFEKKHLNINLEGDFIKMGDELHLLPSNCFNLDKLKVLRNGIHLGTIKEKRFEPNHALAMYLKKENAKNTIDLDYKSKEINDYLKGLTLNSTNKKGFILMCVNGMSVGWCKDDGRILKNLYPKGLRIM